MQPPFGMQDTASPSKHHQSGTSGFGTGGREIRVLRRALIEECTDGCYCCGRKYYDYSNATMVFLKPGYTYPYTYVCVKTGFLSHGSVLF